MKFGCLRYSCKDSVEELKKKGGMRELENLMEIDALEHVHGLPQEYTKLATWSGMFKWRGDKVRSRLRSIIAEHAREDTFAGTLEAFFMRYLIATLELRRKK